MGVQYHSLIFGQRFLTFSWSPARTWHTLSGAAQSSPSAPPSHFSEITEASEESGFPAPPVSAPCKAIFSHTVSVTSQKTGVSPRLLKASPLSQWLLGIPVTCLLSSSSWTPHFHVL